MTNLFVDHFVTWYEVHRRFIPGSDDGYVHTLYKDLIMNLPSDDNGKFDVSNGRYSIEKVTFIKFKYTDKVRLCLGVAIVTTGIDDVEKPQEGMR